MPSIHCKIRLLKIGSWTIARLPEIASQKLPSRGLAMIRGTLNKHPFDSPAEPDGKGGHWFKITEAISEATGVKIGDIVELAFESIDEWPEPEIPLDLKKALEACETWVDITPAARWDWIRWITSTKSPETRKRRLQNGCEMLKTGKRRPCCFNRSLCAETHVSKNGVLFEREN